MLIDVVRRTRVTDLRHYSTWCCRSISGGSKDLRRLISRTAASAPGVFLVGRARQSASECEHPPRCICNRQCDDFSRSVCDSHIYMRMVDLAAETFVCKAHCRLGVTSLAKLLDCRITPLNCTRPHRKFILREIDINILHMTCFVQ